MSTKEDKFYGWVLVSIVFVVYLINASFPFYGASVINTYMAKSLNLSKSMLGLGFSVFQVTIALSSPLAGYCVTRYGSRFTFTIGALTIFLGAVLMVSVVTNAWLFVIVFGVILSTGISLGSMIPAQTTVTYWFKRRKALAMAVVLSAAGVGAIVSTPLMDRVITAFDHNWKAGWFLVIAIAPISALLAALGVRNKPEDLGQIQDGARPEENAADVSTAGKIYQSSESWTTKDALKSKTLWMIVFASIAFYTPFVTCVAHSLIHLQSLGCASDVSAVSLGLTVLFSIFGRLLAGYLGDRMEPRIIWFTALCFIAIGMFILINFSSFGNISIYPYAFFLGVGFGAAYVTLATIVGNYYGTQSFAAIMGAILPIIFLATALGPYIAGAVFDAQGTYTAAFYGLLALALSGAVVIAFAKPPIFASEKLGRTDYAAQTSKP